MSSRSTPKLSTMPAAVIAKSPRSVRLRSVLFGALVIVGLVPLLAIGIMAYRLSKSSLAEVSGQRLQAAAVDTNHKIDRNLFERYGDVQAFAFNPQAAASPEEATQAMNFYMATYGIYDAMVLADLVSGEVVAVTSIDHLGQPTSANNHLLGTTVADQAWFESVSSGAVGVGQSYYGDLEVSETSKSVGENGLVLPFSAPVFNSEGEIVRVWLNLASFDRVVKDIVLEADETLADVGVEGETVFLVDADGLVLFSADESEILTRNLFVGDHHVVIDGNSGFNDVGDEVTGFALSTGAYSFEAYGWSMIVQQHKVDAYAASTTLRNQIILIGILLIFALAVFGRYVAKSVSKRVTPSVESVRSSSLLLERLSADMSNAAESATTEAASVSDGAGELASGVDAVAVAMEQMSEAVREIADSAAHATEVAHDAVTTAAETNEQVGRLGASSAKIGEIVDVISSIAAQTNLLALNATIEAARAGESGKGFAVVANEVKELAEQTASATESISSRVAQLQSDSDGAVGAIGEIGGVIQRISELQITIASAVEEQSATTSEVVRNITEASKNTTNIAASIDMVADSTRQTSETALDVSAASTDLGEVADLLQAFLTD